MEFKKNVVKFMVLLSSIFLLVPTAAFSHGWGGYEQGAKAHGFGGAFTGLADDPTAVFFNPAGIVQMEGTQGSLGFTLVTVRGTYESSGTAGIDSAGKKTDLEDQYFFIPNLFLTKKLGDNLALGFGEYTDFGLGFKWPGSFEGRFAAGGKNAELSTITLNPVVAYKIFPDVSVALGGRVQRIQIKLENQVFLAPGVDEVGSKISGDDYGIGWNAGILWKLTGNLSAGFAYRSKMEHSFDDLDVEFNPQVAALGPIPVGLTNTKAKLNITLPQYASLGVAWKQGPLTLTADVYWWGWSELKEMKFELKQPVGGSSTITNPLGWKDTWTYALGTEYKVKALDRDISLRAGFMYEQCPIPDSTVNPAGYQGDNLLFNIGIGSLIGPVYSDFFFTYVYTKDRTWNNAQGAASNPGGGPITGKFENYNSYLFGSNLTYKF